MPSPTLGFSLTESDQQRVQRLAARYAHGNRSSWLRQALDLFEEREMFDTLARLQARGDRITAEQGIDRNRLAELVAQAAADPDSGHAERVKSLLEHFTGDAGQDTIDPDHEDAETFMAETDEARSPRSAGS